MTEQASHGDVAAHGYARNEADEEVHRSTRAVLYNARVRWHFSGVFWGAELLPLREMKTLLLVGGAELLPLREVEVLQRAGLEGVPALQGRAVEVREEVALQETDLTDALGPGRCMLATGGA